MLTTGCGECESQRDIPQRLDGRIEIGAERCRFLVVIQDLVPEQVCLSRRLCVLRIGQYSYLAPSRGKPGAQHSRLRLEIGYSGKVLRNNHFSGPNGLATIKCIH